jgi:hypothetical protein
MTRVDCVTNTQLILLRKRCVSLETTWHPTGMITSFGLGI